MTSNKSLLFIIILNFTYLSLKWIISFYFFDETLITSVLNNTQDIQYYPLIKSLSEFNLSPTFLDYYQSTKIINFPLASLIIHSLFFKLFNIYSFIILEFILHLILIFILFNIIKKIFNNSTTAAYNFSIIIFIISLFLKYSGNFIDLEYFEKLYSILNENFGTRVPRPLVTGVFYFTFIYYILFFKEKINNQLNFIYIFKITFFLGLLANSFIFLFFNCLVFLIIFTIKSIKQNILLWLKINKIFLFFFIFLLSIFLLPFLIQIFFGEEDYSNRLGLITINIEQKLFLIKYYLLNLLRIEFLILFIITIVLYFYTNKKYIKNFTVERINIFFFFLIGSILSPVLFFILSPKIISIFHFINIMLFSFIFYILLAVFFIISSSFDKLQLNKKFLFNICLSIFVVTSLIFSIPMESKLILKDKVKRNELNEIDNYLKNNDLTNTNLKLFTNDLSVTNLWIFNNNKQLIISDSFSNSLKDHQIEFNLMNTLKDFYTDDNQIKKIIFSEKSQIRNELFMFLFNYKYQANRLYTFSELNKYNKDNQEMITKTSPFRVQMQIIPEDEKERFLNLFNNTQIELSLLPNYVIVNTSHLFENFNIKNEKYNLVFKTKIYKVYKRL
tara:strand:+ start:1121 stop:2968 length:1848 start_codon:yes stop_codon:yes gene_type:complete